MKTISFATFNNNGDIELLKEVQMEIIPRAGEDVYLKGARYRVSDVIFNVDIEISQISIYLEIY